MIRIHKAGYPVLRGILVALILLNMVFGLSFPEPAWLLAAFSIASLVFFFLCLRFFRMPVRPLVPDAQYAYAPADGKVVVIEQTHADDYFRTERLQISTFMSVWDTHSNRAPVSGTVKYIRYRPGKHLIARNPKASMRNESYVIVIETAGGQEVMVRLIAGAMARRIICPLSEGQEVVQGEEIGFIRFGSRVDLLTDPKSDVLVQPGQQVFWNRQAIVKLPFA
jgi:phosphatidylserine decarboxylase